MGYQTVLNGACYVIMVDRYWQVSGDDAVLAEFWDSLKRCNDFSMNLRPAYGLAQVMAMPTPGTDTHGLGDTEWFEAPEPGWKGYVTHAGGVRMAQVQIMRRMAAAMGDDAYHARCDAWLEAGAQALEEHLWAGEYYLNFNEPETGQKSDLVFGYQLDGQWVTDWHGVAGAFPPSRVERTLQTVAATNCALSQSGAVNYATAEGEPAKVGGYGTFSYFPPELYMLAMTYMYNGQQEFGLRSAAALPTQHQLPLGLYLGRAQHRTRRRRHGPARLRGGLLSEHDAVGGARRASERGPDRPAPGGRAGGASHRGGQGDVAFLVLSFWWALTRQRKTNDQRLNCL